LWFRIKGLGFRVWGSGFRVEGLRFNLHPDQDDLLLVG
jgi:hypothetical protein